MVMQMTVRLVAVVRSSIKNMVIFFYLKFQVKQKKFSLTHTYTTGVLQHFGHETIFFDVSYVRVLFRKFKARHKM